MSAALIKLMEPIQTAYQASKEWQEIDLKAYPPPEKKQKKVKDRGSRFPGAKGGVVVPKLEEKTEEKADTNPEEKAATGADQ